MLFDSFYDRRPSIQIGFAFWADAAIPVFFPMSWAITRFVHAPFFGRRKIKLQFTSIHIAGKGNGNEPCLGSNPECFVSAWTANSFLQKTLSTAAALKIYHFAINIENLYIALISNIILPAVKKGCNYCPACERMYYESKLN